MLSIDLSRSVLTASCKYAPPKGGVAQVVCIYSRLVFPVFLSVTNSGPGNAVYKLLTAFGALLQMCGILLLNRRVRIVHIHTASYNSFRRSVWFVRLAKLMRRKVVLHIHGGGFKEYYATQPEWIVRTLNRCDAIIALTPSWQDFFLGVTSGPFVAVVPNIVEPPLKCSVAHHGHCLHLLFLGLVTEAKGIFDLLEVLGEHSAELRGKVMLHVGGNGKTDQLCEYIKRHGIEDIVKFEGWVSGGEKAKLLSACDAFILPSYTEGLPISILEAMAYGKPVLATPVGGIPEIVEHGKNGLLFGAGDKEAMLAAIRLLYENRDLLSGMGKAARVKCSANLPDKVGEVLEDLYKRLLD